MNILAVGAHHDDIELGCGGTIARLSREGHTVYGLILTNSETHYELRSIHRPGSVARREAEEAATVIGLKLADIGGDSRDIGTLSYDVGLMRRIEQFIAEHRVTIVFSHWRCDLNTDHEAASKITIVASRHVPCVLMYRSNWYQPGAPFNGIFFSDISEAIDLKRRSLECYRSEIGNRGRVWIDSFLDHHRVAGYGVECSFAETFEPVKYELFSGIPAQGNVNPQAGL